MRTYQHVWLGAVLCLGLLSSNAWGDSSDLVNYSKLRPGFNALQGFLPTATPRDLVIAQQSQTMALWSVAVGAFFSFDLNPLVLLKNGLRISDGSGTVVGNRVQLDFMLAVGFGEWVELGAVFPIVFYQDSSSNLYRIGQNGPIQSIAQGDLSLLPKFSLLHRWYKGKAEDIKSNKYPNGVPDQGWGVAIGMRTNFPSGSIAAFTSDGVFSLNPTVIVDYRWERGHTLTGQLGVFFRPYVQLTDRLDLGPTLTFSAATEVTIVRKIGLMVMGGFYTNFPLTPAVWKGDFRAIPAEILLGIGWYSSFNVAFRVGFNFGADCGLAVPTFRFWISAIWTLPREYKKVDEWKKGEPVKCPEQYKPGDTVSDACPLAYVYKDNDNVEIRTRSKVYFETNQDALSGESSTLLDKVAEVAKVWLKDNPNDVVCADGYTDSKYTNADGVNDMLGVDLNSPRAASVLKVGDEKNLDLSKRRSARVKEYLMGKGIADKNLCARGYGRDRARLFVLDINPDGSIDPDKADKNRRVQFPIFSFSKGEAQRLEKDPNLSPPLIRPSTEKLSVERPAAEPNRGRLRNRRGEVSPKGRDSQAE